MRYGPEERWLPIPGWEGLYEVSSLGRIKSLARTVRQFYGTKTLPERILKTVPDKDGYPRIVVRELGRLQTFRVHRLVCLLFNGEGPDGAEVDHIDNDRGNASAENLRWTSKSENLGFRASDFSVGENNGCAKLSEAQVREIKSRSNETAKALAREYGVTNYTINDIRQGRSWTHVEAALRVSIRGRAR